MIKGKDLFDKILEMYQNAVEAGKRGKEEDSENIANKMLSIYYDLVKSTDYFINPDSFNRMKKYSGQEDPDKIDLTRYFRLFKGRKLQDEMQKTKLIDLKDFISSGNNLLVKNYEQVLNMTKRLKQMLRNLDKAFDFGFEINEDKIKESDMEQIMESWRKYNKKVLLENRRAK